MPRSGSTPDQVLEVLVARKHQMLVAGEDGIDAVDPARKNEAFSIMSPGFGVDAGMRQRDDDVGALLLDLRNPGLGRLDDVAG